MRFTDRTIKALKPTTDRYEVFEDGRKGLGLRISPTGGKSWIFVYRRQGKLTRITMGRYPDMSLADAHMELTRLRGMHQFSLRRPTEEYQGIMTMIFSGDAHVCFGIHLVGGQFEIKAELIKPDGQTEPLLDLHGGQDGPLAVH